MCLSGQRIAHVHSHHKQEHGPKQIAPNCRPDINYISKAPQEEKEAEESNSDDKYILYSHLGRSQAKQECLKQLLK